MNECKKVVTEFEERMNIKIRWKKLEITEERNLKKGKLLGKYTIKILLDKW